jgi:ArsR family transcriptional regulator, lead/cadmium/zinc/bismuth-responsive transcriptional repressor
VVTTTAVAIDDPDAEEVAGLEPAQMARWADRLGMLADPTRLALMLHIHERGDVRVGELAEQAGLRMPTVSAALRLLRCARLVSSHRSGRFTYYRLADHAVHELLEQICRPEASAAGCCDDRPEHADAAQWSGRARPA